MILVLAHAGHWAISSLYLVPFLIFFWLLFRERTRAKREAEATVAGRAEPSEREDR